MIWVGIFDRGGIGHNADVSASRVQVLRGGRVATARPFRRQRRGNVATTSLPNGSNAAVVCAWHDRHATAARANGRQLVARPRPWRGAGEVGHNAALSAPGARVKPCGHSTVSTPRQGGNNVVVATSFCAAPD